MKNISKSLQEIENIESLLVEWLKLHAPKSTAANVVSMFLGAGPGDYYKADFLAKTPCPEDISQRLLLYIKTYEVSLYLKTKFNLVLNKTGFLSLDNALSFVKAQKHSIKKLGELKVSLNKKVAGIDSDLNQATQTPVTKAIELGLKLLSKKL